MHFPQMLHDILAKPEAITFQLLEVSRVYSHLQQTCFKSMCKKNLTNRAFSATNCQRFLTESPFSLFIYIFFFRDHTY